MKEKKIKIAFMALLLGSIWIKTIVAQQPDLLFFEKTNPAAVTPYELKAERTGKGIRIELHLHKGYGLKRSAMESSVRIFAVDKKGTRSFLLKSAFQGLIAYQDRDYFSSISPLHLHVKPAQGYLLSFHLSYCSFAQGICYQKKEIIKL